MSAPALVAALAISLAPVSSSTRSRALTDFEAGIFADLVKAGRDLEACQIERDTAEKDLEETERSRKECARARIEDARKPILDPIEIEGFGLETLIGVGAAALVVGAVAGFAVGWRARGAP